MKAIIFIVVLLLGCNAKNISKSEGMINSPIIYQYEGQSSKIYSSHYYWLKLPQLSLCGFYVLNRKTNAIEASISDYKTCEYDIEDSYSVENAKFLKNFIKSHRNKIDSAQKRYFDVAINTSLVQEKSHISVKKIIDKANIVLLEVVNVKSNDKLNVRKNANNKSRVIMTLPNGSKKIFASRWSKKNANSTWIRVQYFSEDTYRYHNGWIYSKYVKVRR